jgi:hypothetical protein
LVNARSAALKNSNIASQHMKNQIAQTLSKAGGRVDYVEVILELFSYLSVVFSLKYFLLSSLLSQYDLFTIVS